MSTLACQYSQPKLPGDLDLLTLKVMSESRVTWANSVPILVFLVLSVLDLGPMYATDKRQTDVRRASSLNAPWAGHNKTHSKNINGGLPESQSHQSRPPLVSTQILTSISKQKK